MQEHDNQADTRPAIPAGPAAIRKPQAGDRVIHLNSPFTIGSRKLRAVTVSALSFGDEQDLAGAPRGALLTAMTGLDELALRKLRGPDLDAVLTTAVDLLPIRLREALDA